MFGKIPERDWKLFRRLQDAALERYCERALKEIGGIAADERQKFHERFLAIYDLIRECDKTLSDLLSDISRSKALLQLVAMQSRGLLTPDEIAGFSEETQECLRRFREIDG